MKLAKLCFFTVFEVAATAVMSGFCGLILDALFGKRNWAEAAPTFSYIVLMVILASFCPVMLGGVAVQVLGVGADAGSGAGAGNFDWRRMGFRLGFGLLALLAAAAVILSFGGAGGPLNWALLACMMVVGLVGWEFFGRWWLR